MTSFAVVTDGPAEHRIGLFQDDALIRLELERPDLADPVGSVHLGRVAAVDRALGAAMITLGDGSTGFLGFEAGGERVAAGQAVLVRVVRAPEAGKHAGLSTRIELAGNFLVLTVGGQEIACARRIGAGEVRDRLRTWLAQAALPGEGWLARSQAATAPIDRLAMELAGLRAAAAAIAGGGSRAAPALLYQPPGPRDRLIAGLPAAMPVWVGSGATLAALRALRPDLDYRRADAEHLDRLELAIETALTDRVALPDRGMLHIQQTAALVAIDVDRGGGGDVATINRAAATVIAQQLPLRRLGGMILIDFLRGDMALRTALRDQLAAGLAEDAAQLLGWTRAGLFEITRPHGGPTLAAMLGRDCPVCRGEGRLPSLGAAAADLWRGLLKAADADPAWAPACGVASDLLPVVAAQIPAAGQLLGRAPRLTMDSGLPPGGWRLDPGTGIR